MFVILIIITARPMGSSVVSSMLIVILVARFQTSVSAQSRELVACAGAIGKVSCPTCGGDGQIERSGPCTAHTVSSGHYYCTSSSHHGNNVAQYHK